MKKIALKLDMCLNMSMPFMLVGCKRKKAWAGIGHVFKHTHAISRDRLWTKIELELGMQFLLDGCEKNDLNGIGHAIFHLQNVEKKAGIHIHAISVG